MKVTCFMIMSLLCFSGKELNSVFTKAAACLVSCNLLLLHLGRGFIKSTPSFQKSDLKEYIHFQWKQIHSSFAVYGSLLDTTKRNLHSSLFAAVLGAMTRHSFLNVRSFSIFLHSTQSTVYIKLQYRSASYTPERAVLGITGCWTCGRCVQQFIFNGQPKWFL